MEEAQQTEPTEAAEPIQQEPAIGVTYIGSYPVEAVRFCNENGCIMEKSGDSYTIRDSPPMLREDLIENKSAEILYTLSRTDWMSIREADRKAMNPDYEPDPYIYSYRQFIRDFDEQPEWWNVDIPDFEYWKAKQKSEEGN
jgi:hypothetical protein